MFLSLQIMPYTLYLVNGQMRGKKKWGQSKGKNPPITGKQHRIFIFLSCFLSCIQPIFIKQLLYPKHAYRCSGIQISSLDVIIYYSWGEACIYKTNYNTEISTIITTYICIAFNMVQIIFTCIFSFHFILITKPFSR